MTMTPQEVQKRIMEIIDASADNEQAHSLEDYLYVELLIAIRDGNCDDPAECARIALTSQDYSFNRWCA